MKISAKLLNSVWKCVVFGPDSSRKTCTFAQIGSKKTPSFARIPQTGGWDLGEGGGIQIQIGEGESNSKTENRLKPATNHMRKLNMPSIFLCCKQLMKSASL